VKGLLAGRSLPAGPHNRSCYLLFDDVGYREKSILGKDIRDQSPYTIERGVTVNESGGSSGSALWRSCFSLATVDRWCSGAI